MADTDTMLVRLHAYEPRRGHVLQRFMYKGTKFQPGRGWYKVNADAANYLKTVRQRNEDPHSPLAFDVCTEAKAQKIDAAEEKARSGTRRKAKS